LYGENTNTLRVLMRKREGKIPHLKPRLRWEDNTETDTRDGRAMDQVNVAQDNGKVAGSCEHDNEPSILIKCTGYLD
jgi:hypothetical protein